MADKMDQAIHAVAAAAATPTASVPPTTVAAATILGYPPSELLVWLSICWIIVQFAALVTDRILRWRKMCREKEKTNG